MKTAGIYCPYIRTKGGGEKVCLTLAHVLSRKMEYEVTIITHGDINIKELGRYFNLNLKGLKVQVIDFDTWFSRLINRLQIPGKFRDLLHNIKTFRAIKRQNYDLFVNNAFQSNLPAPVKNSVYMCMFPQRLKARDYHNFGVVKKFYLWVINQLERVVLHPKHKYSVRTYKAITANSNYTKKYIKKYWGMNSRVLYPVCENMHKNNIPKEKIILHTGRFFENIGESHHKRQDFLLKVFRELTDMHKEGWRLYLTGSVAQDYGGFKYIYKLMKEAEGFPVSFRFDCSYDELRTLYNKATIYWHATGYGSGVKNHPEKQEHFGITTVEAMSAKAVPVVYNTAGQKESVINNKNGYLWNTPAELKEHTREVVRMTKDKKLSFQTEGVNTAKKFSKDSFAKSVIEIFSSVEN